jgi:hypothetical protein
LSLTAVRTLLEETLIAEALWQKRLTGISSKKKFAVASGFKFLAEKLISFSRMNGLKPTETIGVSFSSGAGRGNILSLPPPRNQSSRCALSLARLAKSIPVPMRVSC